MRNNSTEESQNMKHNSHQWVSILHHQRRHLSEIFSGKIHLCPPSAVAILAVATDNPNRQCCGTVTIFLGSGSGSDFWKVMVPVPVLTFEKVMVPVPVPTFEKLRSRFRFQLHIYTIKSKFFLKNLFPFNIVSCFTRKKIININIFIVKCERKKC